MAFLAQANSLLLLHQELHIQPRITTRQRPLLSHFSMQPSFMSGSALLWRISHEPVDDLHIFANLIKKDLWALDVGTKTFGRIKEDFLAW